MMKKQFLFSLLALSVATGVKAEGDEARLLRFPATNGTDVVFTYAGDLYTAPLTGGEARRLTSHIGYEMFARFSPDGKTIAFTGEYDGNREVYVMPAEGGEPRRLTYTSTNARDDVGDRMGPNNIVMAWTADGQNCPCPKAAFAAIRRTANAWPTTVCSASSATGSTIGAAWRTTSGSTTRKARRWRI